MDPPYNQHRYFTNYHIWETLVRWPQNPKTPLTMNDLVLT
jgi:adenine-specific DNA methylase